MEYYLNVPYPLRKDWEPLPEVTLRVEVYPEEVVLPAEATLQADLLYSEWLPAELQRVVGLMDLSCSADWL